MEYNNKKKKNLKINLSYIQDKHYVTYSTDGKYKLYQQLNRNNDGEIYLVYNNNLKSENIVNIIYIIEKDRKLNKKQFFKWTLFDLLIFNYLLINKI